MRNIPFKSVFKGIAIKFQTKKKRVLCNKEELRKVTRL